MTCAEARLARGLPFNSKKRLIMTWCGESVTSRAFFLTFFCLVSFSLKTTEAKAEAEAGTGSFGKDSLKTFGKASRKASDSFESTNTVASHIKRCLSWHSGSKSSADSQVLTTLGDCGALYLRKFGNHIKHDFGSWRIMLLHTISFQLMTNFLKDQPNSPDIPNKLWRTAPKTVKFGCVRTNKNRSFASSGRARNRASFQMRTSTLRYLLIGKLSEKPGPFTRLRGALRDPDGSFAPKNGPTNK